VAQQSDEVLAAKGAGELIYYKLNPKDRFKDGRVQRGDESIDVSFWSYVSTVPVEPIEETPFHRELWSGDVSSDEWQKKFVTKEIPLSEEDLAWIRNFTNAAAPKGGPAITKTLASGLSFPIR